jgi:hypothetical protein
MALIAGGNRRALLVGGIAVLVLAGAAAAWYFFLRQEPPPPPRPLARVQARKPAPKPAAPPKVEEAPIPKTAEAAATEVLARSGLDTFAEHYREGALQSIANPPPGASNFTPADQQAFREAVNRVLAGDKLNNLLAEQLKRSFEPIQFGRFISLLRQPISEKMTKLESRVPAPADLKQFVDKLKANPPSQDRRDLIQRIDVATGSSEWAADMSVAVTRSMVEAALAASGQASKDAMRDAARDMTQLRRQTQTQIHTMLFYVYREASDAELKQYAELLESETGRWGTTMLANALKSVIESSGRELGTEFANIAVARRDATSGGKRVATAGAPKPEKPEAKEAIKTMSRAEAMAMQKAEPQPEAKAEAKPPRAPAAAPAYRRPPDLPVLYAHYNDLVSAVWMGDFPAARELLDDGKDPNARDADGNTALMIAVRRGDLPMAHLLVTRGADVTAGQQGGATPLELAERAGNFDLTRLLRSHGAQR